MRLTSERSVRRIVLVLFFLSGACGLVYEVVWMRMLTLVFGATAFATSAILASFFAGLALGSLYFGRVADRSRNPLALYAYLEVGVALFAFLMPLLFAGLTEVYVAVARKLELGFYPLSLVRLFLSFLILLLPTTLMGGTLPVIVKFLVRRKDRLGISVASLYSVNTFGAVVGTVGAGFFLILLVGVRESAYLAGVVNLIVAGVALALSRSVKLEDTEHTGASPAEAAQVTMGGDPVDKGEASLPEPDLHPWESLSPALARLALWAVGLSGMCALALEVLWTRSLVYFLDNSTHAFTTMLTAFLLGIALGSAAVARVVDRRIRLLAAFGLVEVLIGFFALLAIPILASSTPVLEGMEGVAADSMLLWKWTGLRFLTSLSVMLVPTVLMGMTVPLVAKIYTLNLARLGTSLGRVYSINTLGGVVGSVLAGFVLVPTLGVHDGIVLVALFSGVIGVTLLLAEPALGGRSGVKGALVAGVVIILGGASWLTRDGMVLTSYKERVDGAEVIFYREGIGSTVKVFRDNNGDKLISIDGFPVAGTTLGMFDAQQSLGNLPLLLTNVPQARVHLVGFGAGGASWEVLQYDVAKVDCVELVPGVIEAAQYLTDVNHDVLNEPRYNLVMGDGRNYALVTDETYDVISIDATSPKMAGNGSLYTREFYELVRARLTENGMAVQWLPFHLLSEAEVKMTAKTFMEVFPHTTVWLSPLRHHGLLVGTLQQLQIDFQAMGEKLLRPGVRRELEPMGVSDAFDVLAWFVMGEEALERYVEGARVNTDNHPYLEFSPAWSYFVTLRYATRNLYAFGQARESPHSLLVNTGADEDEVADVALRVEKRFQATQHSISGDIFYYLGEREKAAGEYAMALLIDPDDKNAAHPIWRYLPPAGTPR
ncbi:MAG TPA: fused MFS/spermidine synthase [Longimicrobiales bacterium]|nr:fused MFS/spermidine synthase [Longimicrobiales bacterium]